ncbi:DUF262 domain-containing protein [Hirschia litorea]|uniref:DUF262 domain-containing protein n=1 Tax=Hirschia litorea TaxID=1199156 RepID=A0ABW2IMR5_9PROT
MTDENVQNFRTNLDPEGIDSFDSDDHSEAPPTDIVAFNELRSCADLFRLEKRGLLDLQPTFQRDFVWSNTAQTRFIDSLIKGLPIPSMCFAHDWKRDEYQVIDGLQRISTIVKFLDETVKWKLAKDEDIEPKIAGKFVSEIRDGSKNIRKFYDRLENITIPVTILRCDMEKTSHSEYVFTIFHRLNTGGSKLNNQEIRNCIYNGSLNQLLAKLDTYIPWRSLNKMDEESNYRYTKQELILRLFAFHHKYQKYSGRLSKFLNEYMKTYRNADDRFLADKEQLFIETIDITYDKVFRGEAPEKINISIIEAVLVGVASNLEYLKALPSSECVDKYTKLVNLEPFSAEKLKEGLSGKPRVIERMQTAIDVFSPDGY